MQIGAKDWTINLLSHPCLSELTGRGKKTDRKMKGGESRRNIIRGNSTRRVLKTWSHTSQKQLKWREICLRSLKNAYKMIQKCKLKFTTVYNDLWVTFEVSRVLQSTQQCKVIWPHARVFYKCIHQSMNKQWLLTHNLLSWASQIEKCSLSKTFLFITNGDRWLNSQAGEADQPLGGAGSEIKQTSLTGWDTHSSTILLN